MKRILSTAILAFAASFALAKDAFELIEQNGVFRFSDGSSVYVFERNGRFEMHPLSMSGRVITGKWTKSDSSFRIEGEWSWLNGMSEIGDTRTMRLHVSPLEGEEIVGYRKEVVMKVYHVIEEIQKKK